MRNDRQVIQSVCLTEKATLLSESDKPKYVFRVDKKANKIEIKNAIEEVFKVKVVSVNTCNYRGKLKRERTMHYGRRAAWKKAIVTLAEDSTLDLV